MLSKTQPHQHAQRLAIGRVVEQLVLPQMAQSRRQGELHRRYAGARTDASTDARADASTDASRCADAREAVMPHHGPHHGPDHRLHHRLQMDADSVARYVDVLLHNRTAHAVKYAQDLCSGGISLRDVYLGLLAPAARLLGERWVRDDMNFSEVTLATWQLEQVVQYLSEAFESQHDTTMRRGALLVAMLPGEQHTFGARMLVSFFRRSGWDARLLPLNRPADLLRALRAQPIDVLALSLSQREGLHDLAPLVKGVRGASRKPGLRVLLGGRAVHENPRLAQASGACVCTGEADEAVVLAEQRLD